MNATCRTKNDRIKKKNNTCFHHEYMDIEILKIWQRKVEEKKIFRRKEDPKMTSRKA
jgi:hypothetical protein